MVSIPLVRMMNDIPFRKMFKFSKTTGLTIFTEYLQHLWVTWPTSKRDWINKHSVKFITGHLVHIFEPAQRSLQINLGLHLAHCTKHSEQFDDEISIIYAWGEYAVFHALSQGGNYSALVILDHGSSIYFKMVVSCWGEKWLISFFFFLQIQCQNYID